MRSRKAEGEVKACAVHAMIVMTLARDPQTVVFYEMKLSMKWRVVSKGNDRCRAAKFRWRLHRYESLNNACRNASHEWTRRLIKKMRRMERSIRRIGRKMRRMRMMRRMMRMRGMTRMRKMRKTRLRMNRMKLG